MKFLCVCDYGQVRSVALARLLQMNDHEAIPVGVCTLNETSFNYFAHWADKIVDLTTQGFHWIDQYLFPLKSKYVRLDIGIDRWGNPFNEELEKILEEKIKEMQW